VLEVKKSPMLAAGVSNKNNVKCDQKTLHIDLIWFTDPKSPTVPTGLIRLFFQGQVSINIWSTEPVIKLLQKQLEEVTRQFQALGKILDITYTSWEIFKTKGGKKNLELSSSVANIQQALNRKEWSTASDILKILLLEDASRPTLYLDMKISPFDGAIKRLLNSKCVGRGVLYNSNFFNICGEHGLQLGGRNNLHYTNGSVGVKKLFKIARIIADYFNSIIALIQAAEQPRPYDLIVITTGNAIAYAINAYVSQRARVRFLTRRINENEFFAAPTGGHDELSLKEIGMKRAEMNLFLQQSCHLSAQQKQQGAMEAILESIVERKRSVLMDDQGVLYRGSIFSTEDKPLFGPYKDTYVSAGCDPAYPKQLPGDFLDDIFSPSM
jgi:hypothetical protein